MDIVHSRLNVLERIWSELGGCSTDGDTILTASSDKARTKLKDVISHINTAIQNEIRERQLLSAEIEDLMASVDVHCAILGMQIDNVLAKSFVTENDDLISATIGGWLIDLHGENNPTFARRRALQTLDTRLQAEVDQRWSYVNAWIAGIQDICEELEIQGPNPPTKPDPSDLSWATVQGISCKYRDYLKMLNDKRYRFESSAMMIHFYSNALSIPINQDATFDNALRQLLDTIPPPSIIPTSPPEHHIYYNPSLPQPLSVKDECLEYLSSKVLVLEIEYRERCGRRAKLQRGIKAMWDELHITDRKLQMTESVTLEYLEELQQEFDMLHSLLRRMTNDYIDQYHDCLLSLWESCMISQQEREAFIESLHAQAETMDQVKQIVKDYILYLKRIEPYSSKVYRAIRMRKTQIQKMVDFEITASDPRRLFKSSFQLLEEERWRKTCFPTLLKMEDDLVSAVQELESVMGKHFVLDDERFLTTLQREIADRDAQQTFFGFMDTPSQSRKNTQDSYFAKQPDTSPDSKMRISRASTGYSLHKSKVDLSRSRDVSEDPALSSSSKGRCRNGSLSSPGPPTRTRSTSILDRADSATQMTKNTSHPAWARTHAADLNSQIGRSASSMIGQGTRRNSTLTGSVSMQALTKPQFRNKRHSYDSLSSSDSDKLAPATPPLQRPSTIPEMQDRLDSLEEL